MTGISRMLLCAALTCMTAVHAAENLHFGPAQNAQNQLVDEIALVINDEAVTRRQFNAELARERAALPKNLPLSGKALDKQLSERVIMHHLLQQIEKKMQLNISDDVLNAAVRQVAQQNHLSEAALYEQVKRTTGLNPGQYRQQLRRSLLTDKLKEALVGQDIQISDAQVNDRIAQIAQQKGSMMHVQDLLLPVPEGEPTERGAAVKAQIVKAAQILHKNGNDMRAAAAALPGADFHDLGQVNPAQIPPRFARVLVQLAPGAVTETPVVDRDGIHFLKVLSQGNADKQYQVREADVAHILLRTDKGRDAQAQKARIDAIYEQLRHGADFAALARRYSEDPKSAAKGGELGWVSPQEIGGKFAEVMTHLPVGQISAPVKTPYGYHIILIHDRRQTDKRESLLREQVRRDLYAKALEDAWQQRLQALRQAAYVDIR